MGNHRAFGDRLRPGEALAEVHAADAAAAEAAAEKVLASYQLGDAPPEPRSVVLEMLE